MDYLIFFTSFISIVVLGYLLAEGSDNIGIFIGRRFSGRIILSITSELPEFLIVVYSVILNIPDIGLGAIFGSNILMMSLGLAVFILASTTRFSLKPIQAINLNKFKNDIIVFLLLSIIIPITYIDGYGIFDAIIFLLAYSLYLYLTAKERKIEVFEMDSKSKRKINKKILYLSSLFVAIGTIGLIFVSETFTSSLNSIAISIGIPAIVLTLVVSPLAAEMPEKVSLIFLARKGGESIDTMIGTIFGSKILNSSLLITMFIVLHSLIFGSKISFDYIGFLEALLSMLVAIIATILMIDRKVTKIEGIILLLVYVFVIIFQFILLYIIH